MTTTMLIAFTATPAARACADLRSDLSIYRSWNESAHIVGTPKFGSSHVEITAPPQAGG